MRVEIELVDVCFPDYLTDLHNREGELLVGIPLDELSQSSLEDLIVEELSSGDFGLPDEVSDDDLKEACRTCNLGPYTKITFESLDYTFENDLPSAWFVVRWDV